jgi:hypothetical protein
MAKKDGRKSCVMINTGADADALGGGGGRSLGQPSQKIVGCCIEKDE